MSHGETDIVHRYFGAAHIGGEIHIPVHPLCNNLLVAREDEQPIGSEKIGTGSEKNGLGSEESSEEIGESSEESSEENTGSSEEIGASSEESSRIMGTGKLIRF